MTEQTLYLSSLESERLEPVRRCRIVEFVIFESGKVAAVAQLEPSVNGQDFNRSAEVSSVVLAPRHEGASINPVSEFPLFVFVAIPRRGLDRVSSPVRTDDLEIIGWGELYRTPDDAERHRFG